MNNQEQRLLSGQVAVVTGAGRGIGAAIARKLASTGASVVLCGRSLGPLQSTAAAISAISGRAEAVQCDVSNLESLQSQLCSTDDSCGKWTHCQHFVARGKESAAERSNICGLEMGPERP